MLKLLANFVPMSELLKKYRLPLKLQVISWFLLSENIGPHVTGYQRLIEVEDDLIILNTYELSEFYQIKFIDNSFGDWANGLVAFLLPKLSLFFYDLGEIQPFVTLQVIHKKMILNKNIKLTSTL